MAVPDFQEMMLPLLQFGGDGQKHRVSEAMEHIAVILKLSDEDIEEKLPSGETRLKHRVYWARTYLKKAGLLSVPERGTFKITEEGLNLLKENLSSLTRNDLKKRYPEFRDFIKPHIKPDHDVTTTVEGEKTPEELLEEGYTDLYETLVTDLLEKIKSESPQFFEKLVVDLLVKMGYGGSRKDAGEAIGRVGDGGIDGIIKEDKLGLDVIYIQAKRWENTVGRPSVQAFAGSLEGVRAKRGIMITTSQFSSEAHEYVRHIEKKIVLVDGEMLAKLMIDHNLGVSAVASYDIKKVDSDYFEED